MTPEQKQRIEQIRARRRAIGPVASDVDFLLSLVKSQEAENGYWPTLLDRGDGVRDHFCVGRLIKPGEIYWEFWNKGRWVSAGEVFVGREAAQKQLDAIRASDAASMRSVCVGKVKAKADALREQIKEAPAAFVSAVSMAQDVVRDLAKELESLSIEREK